MCVCVCVCGGGGGGGGGRSHAVKPSTQLNSFYHNVLYNRLMIGVYRNLENFQCMLNYFRFVQSSTKLNHVNFFQTMGNEKL